MKTDRFNSVSIQTKYIHLYWKLFVKHHKSQRRVSNLKRSDSSRFGIIKGVLILYILLKISLISVIK